MQVFPKHRRTERITLVLDLSMIINRHYFRPAKDGRCLRTLRRRSGLTQADVAFLLGCTSGSKVSRYGRLGSEPNLEKALACQIVFNVTPNDLFPGIYQKVAQKVIDRAEILSQRLGSSKGDVRLDVRLQAL